MPSTSSNVDRRGKYSAEYSPRFATSGHYAGASRLLNEEGDTMRMNWILGTAVVAMSVTAVVSAQSKKDMERPSKSDTMSMTYTGCVESVNHGGTFVLTHADSMGAESMEHGTAMKHQEDTKKGEPAKSTHEQMPMAAERMDMMPSKSFVLAGTANLSKHVGNKVSVTGSVSDGATGTMRQDVSTLTIKTLKVIAKSCS